MRLRRYFKDRNRKKFRRGHKISYIRVARGGTNLAG